MAELDLCVKRHGEVNDVFFYDTPTLLVPPSGVLLAREGAAASWRRQKLRRIIRSSSLCAPMRTHPILWQPTRVSAWPPYRAEPFRN